MSLNPAKSHWLQRMVDGVTNILSAVRTLISKGGNPSAEEKPFALNYGEIGAALICAIIVGFCCWGSLTWWCKSDLNSAIRNAPNPFASALTGTAYELAQRPGLTISDDQAMKLLAASLRQMGLKGGDGRPMNEDDLDKLQRQVALSVRVGPAGIFTNQALTGTMTVVRLILNDDITPQNQFSGTNTAEQTAHEMLIKQLKEEHAIVRSPEFIATLAVRKGIPTDALAKAATGTNDVPAIHLWPFLHQLDLRCLQRVQIDKAVRDARFYVTFVAGWDVLGMWVLFWFMLFVLAWRRSSASLERKYSVKDQNVSKTLKTLENALKDNDFDKVDAELQTLGGVNSQRAPIFCMMLEIVQYELDVKGNYSEPDALLVFTHRLREEMASSRWLVIWCGRALPTIGFIFKVYGIASAMKDSDTIALASGSLDQAAAIANVSGALGLAFSATFVAFLLSLAVGYLESWEAHYERSVISDLESSLLRLLTVPPHESGFDGDGNPKMSSFGNRLKRLGARGTPIPSTPNQPRTIQTRPGQTQPSQPSPGKSLDEKLKDP
jgi:hypothetical protein